MRINSNIVEKKKCPKSAQKTIFKPNLEKRRMSESLKITAVNKNISKSRDNSFKSNIFLKVNQTPRIVKTADGRRNYSIRREKKVIEGEYV